MTSLPSWRRSGAAVLVVLLAALVPACLSDAGDADADTGLDQALCEDASSDVFLTIKGSAAASVYADAAGTTKIGTLPSGTTVVRKSTREAKANEPLSEIVVRGGDSDKMSGWVDAQNLALAAPSHGSCTNGVNFESKAHAFERGQTVADEPLAAEVMKDTLQCVVGLGDGVGSEATGFVQGFGALAKGAFGIAKEVAKRDELIFLYAMGSKEAGAKLVAIGASDETKMQGAVGVVTHAIPVLHRMLSREWVFYRALDHAHKANYLCQLVGRLAFEVVVWIGTADLAGVADATKLGQIDAANELVAQAAEIPGRLGDTPMFEIGHGFAATQEEAYWQRIQQNLSAVAGKDSGTKQRLIRSVSDDMNVPSIADAEGIKVNVGIGNGNCGNAAFATMFSLARGAPICTLPYLKDGMASIDQWESAFRSFGLPTRQTEWLDDAGIEAELQAQLAEGEMAFVTSTSVKAGHGTVAVKLEGKIFNINNQGWEKAIGVPDGQLQPFGAWMQTWTKEFGGSIHQATYAGLKLPQ